MIENSAVPLVIYIDNERIVIGQAILLEDGSLHTEFNEHGSEILKDNPMSVSMVPTGTRPGAFQPAPDPEPDVTGPGQSEDAPGRKNG